MEYINDWTIVAAIVIALLLVYWVIVRLSRPRRSSRSYGSGSGSSSSNSSSSSTDGAFFGLMDFGSGGSSGGDGGCSGGDGGSCGGD